MTGPGGSPAQRRGRPSAREPTAPVTPMRFDNPGVTIGAPRRQAVIPSRATTSGGSTMAGDGQFRALLGIVEHFRRGVAGAQSGGRDTPVLLFNSFASARVKDST